jgi:uncharacterized protein (UPF0305 family)
MSTKMEFVQDSKEKIIVDQMMHLLLEKIWNVKEMKKHSLIVEVIKILHHVIMNKML